MTGNYFPIAWDLLNKLWEITALVLLSCISIGMIIYLICIIICIIKTVIEEYFQ